MVKQPNPSSNSGISMVMGSMVLYHGFGPAAPVMCSPCALKAEIIPVHLPEEAKARKHPSGTTRLVRTCLSMGIFIYNSLIL